MPIRFSSMYLKVRRIAAETSYPTEVDFLREELSLAKQRVQTLIEERDAANQEFAVANEEIQSSNEELQSINEELETSKRELQSANEELNRVNIELQNRNQELGRLSDDLTNLFSSTTIPMLMLDNELRIRRITPVAETMLNIGQGDVGRPIRPIQMKLSVDVGPLVRGVIETLQAEEMELQDRKGHWHLLRVQPYRTSDNRIDGAVLTLIDVNQLRTARIEAETARAFAESVVESIKTPLVTLREDFRVRAANRAFYEDYQVEPAQVENRLFLDLDGTKWGLPELRIAFEQIVRNRAASPDLEFEGEFHGQGKRTLCINLFPVEAAGEKLILMVIEDVTDRKQAEHVLLEEQERLKLSVEASATELQKTSERLHTEALGREQVETALHATERALLQSREELRHLSASLMNAQDAERRRVSRELHDDLSQKVAKLQFDIETLEQKVPFKDVQHAKQQLRDVGHQAAGLSNDLRRVAHQLHPATLDHLGLAVALRAYAEEFSRSTAIPVKFTSLYVPRKVPIEVASGLYRIAQEALRNVGKHASEAKIEIVLARDPKGLALFIRDDGEGFDMESARAKGGLGLISMEERVRLLGGSFSVETRPGEGVLIAILCPLPEAES